MEGSTMLTSPSPTLPLPPRRPARKLPATLVAMLATTLVLLVGAAPAAQAASLPVRLSAAVGASGVSSTTSVVAWDHSAQRIIYQHLPNRALAPASNMKLFTSAAALRGLGPEHRFTTTVALSGRQVGDVWRGDVYLVGGGDPTLSTRTFALRYLNGQGANIGMLVLPLRFRGIKAITGRLIVVEDFLDRQRYVRGWKPEFRYNEVPALGGLTVNQSYSGERLGTYSSREPAIFAGGIYRDLLRRNGITVRGDTRIGRLPSYATQAGHVLSPPLRLIVRHMNQHSDNFYAEILLKDIGRVLAGPGRGTTVNGAFAAERQLNQMGLRTTPLNWVDGSGLAYGNRVTGRLMSDLLNIGIQQRPWGVRWWESFAVSGGTGTMRGRMTTWPWRGRVRGKTGTLSHASALSGYSTRLSGRTYGFAVLTWNSSGGYVDYARARGLQDRVARILVR